MKHNWHIKALVGVALAGVLIWGAYWSAGKFSSAMTCADTLLHEVASPDGQYKVYVFKRVCGATIPDSAQANMQPTGTAFDGTKYRPFVAIEGTSNLDARWDAPDQLTVIGSKNGHASFEHARVYTIKIKYE